MKNITIYAARHRGKKVRAAYCNIIGKHLPVVSFYIEWRENYQRQWRGPFVVPINTSNPKDIAHYDLVLGPDIVLTPETKIHSAQVGLRPWKNDRPNPEERVCWGLDSGWRAAEYWLQQLDQIPDDDYTLLAECLKRVLWEADYALATPFGVAILISYSEDQEHWMVCLLCGLGTLRFTTSVSHFGFSVRLPRHGIAAIDKKILLRVFEYLLVAPSTPKKVQEALRRNEEAIRTALET